MFQTAGKADEAVVLAFAGEVGEMVQRRQQDERGYDQPRSAGR